MQITFLQSGGFAGALRGVRIDSLALPERQRAELERLVANSGVHASCERFSESGRDRRQYDLAIDRAGRVIRLSCDETCLPETTRPLVEFLAARATPQTPDFQLPEATDTPPGSGPAPENAATFLGEVRDAFASDWGRFEGEVVARWENDGRQMTLVEPFAYVDPRLTRWPAAAGSSIDGASIPRAFWTVIGGPFAGDFRNASVVHDVACDVRDRPWRAVHRMFYEACRCGGVGGIKAKTMYYAVFHFGPRWHIEERTIFVAGKPHVEPVIRAEMPTPPTEADVAAIVNYFATHEVAAEDIPVLKIPDTGD